MKLLLLGVSRRVGISKNGTGTPYDICNLNSTTTMQSRDNEHNKFQAAGQRQIEIELAPEAINQFLALEYPREYEVTTGTRPSQNGLVTVVTGLAK